MSNKLESKKLESKYALSSAFSPNPKNTTKHKKAFIPFITCGYPSIALSEQILYVLESNGADIIEIGIPFSDPIAEGETIQKSSAKALQNGVHCEEVFDFVKRVRSKSEVKLAFMTYANIIFAYGIESFVAKMASLGVGGLILADVPYEEKGVFVSACEKYGIDFITLVAPSSKHRVDMVVRHSSGFIYCVSSLGVTGVRSEVDNALESMISKIRKFSSTPIAVGFGISNPTQAKKIASYADGIIIGSAIMKICEKNEKDEKKCVEEVAKFAREIKDAISQ